MKKKFIEEIRNRLLRDKKVVIELDRDTSLNIYGLLYSRWLNDYKPGIIKRIFNPQWKYSVLSETLRTAEREILPTYSEVNFKSILLDNKIKPTEMVFINSGIYEEPSQVVLKEYFLENQDEFWLASQDLGIFDESFSWVINVDDSGGTTISKLEES